MVQRWAYQLRLCACRRGAESPSWSRWWQPEERELITVVSLVVDLGSGGGVPGLIVGEDSPGECYAHSYLARN